MIIHQENEQTFGNSSNSTSFKISASAKAFKILSSNIYKNKIRAVVRELVCNAVDAHVLNMQTGPFSIRCPNQLDPRFIVRDFGPGLSHEDMIELYTTYFASTKAERNDQIGALGLGSKSPFSYTPTFSVNSFHDGVVRAYQCMLTNGEPSIVQTGEFPYEESDRDGIEVIVPAKLDDLAKWANEIAYVMRPFKSGSYTIIGSTIDVKSFDKLENYSTEYFVDTSSQSYSSNFYAIYGNIVYPLSDIPGLEALWLNSQRKNMYFHFEPGELDFQPSREELSLDPRTIENILKKVKIIEEKSFNSEIEKLSKITSLRELKRTLNKMPSSQSDVISNKKIKFLDKTYDQLFVADPLITNEFFEMLHLATVYGTSNSGKPIRKTLKFNQPARLVSTLRIEMMFNFKRKRLFILNQDDRKMLTKTINGLWLSDDPNHPIDDLEKHILVLNLGNPVHDQILEHCKKIMGDDEVIVLNSSDLEEVRKLNPGYGVKSPTTPKVREYRPASPNAYKMTLTHGFYSKQELFLTASEFNDTISTTPFVGMYRDTICLKSAEFGQFPKWKESDVIRMALKLEVQEFIIVRPSLFDKANLKDNPCLFNMFFEKFESLVNSVKYDEYYYFSSQYKKFFNNLDEHEFIEIKKEFSKGYKNESAEINWWFDELETSLYHKLNGTVDVQKCFDIYRENRNKKVEEFKDLMAKFKNDYYVIYYYLNDRYYLEPERIEQIKNMFAFLKANKWKNT